MVSLKEKIAALRAKRAAQKPKVSRPFAFEASHSHLSWTHLQQNVSDMEHVQSDDDIDEDGELIVLPPPAPHASAQRQLWKMQEIHRARQKVVRKVTDSCPSLLQIDNIPVEPCSEEASPEANGNCGADVPDEKEMALKSAVKDDDSEEDDDEDEEKDEEELALESYAKQALEKDDSTPHMPDNTLDELEALSPRRDSGKEKDKMCASTSPAEQLSSPSPKDHPPEPAKRLGPFEDASKPTSFKMRGDDSRLSAGLIEDEADDDDRHEVDSENEQCSEDGAVKDAFKNDIGCEDDVNDEDCDASKIAAFHQKWILDKHTEEVNALKGPDRLSDSDEAITPEKKEAAEDGKGLEGSSAVGAGSEADEGAVEMSQGNDGPMRSGDYVQAMFLRDDSRSRYVEEDNDEDEGNDADGLTEAERREKARVLWKVRKKNKTSLFREDENSLSRFDIFDDPDKCRGANIRSKIESACRPVSTQDIHKRRPSKNKEDKRNGSLKRSAPWAADRSVPEWEKRKACMQQKARKRQRSVSVGKWSFAAHGERPKASNKTTKIGFSSGNSTSLGATCLTRKSRPRLPAPRRDVKLGMGMKPNRSSKPSKGPTSFKGLLSVLGEKAELDL